MADGRRAARILAHKRHGRGEDALPPLPSLHGARGERPPLADVLDVVHDGDLAVAREHEVAVHAVHSEVRGHRPLASGEAVRDDRAAVDAAGSWGMPEGPSVREGVLRR